MTYVRIAAVLFFTMLYVWPTQVGAAVCVFERGSETYCTDDKEFSLTSAECDENFVFADASGASFESEGFSKTYDSAVADCDAYSAASGTTAPATGVPVNTGAQSADNTDASIAQISTETASLNPLSAPSIPILIGQAIRFVTGLFGSIALVMIIYGGLQMMFAGGKGDRFKSGAKVIAWASIGLITMMLSYVLVSFVLNAILYVG